MSRKKEPEFNEILPIFIRRKITELLIVLFIIFLIIGVPLAIGSIAISLGDNNNCPSEGCSNLLYMWTMGLLYLTLGLLIITVVGFFLYVFFSIIIDFIKANWEAARKEAKSRK